MRVNERAIKEELPEGLLEAMYYAGRVRVTQSAVFPPRESAPPQESDGPQWCLLWPVFQQGDLVPSDGGSTAECTVKHVDADNFELLLHVPFFGLDWPQPLTHFLGVPSRNPLEWQIAHVLSYDEEMLLRNLGYEFLEEVK
jgi:hypothetical protein